MKLFHISDLLSITTRRLVSSRHLAGFYDILNFLTGDKSHSHQVPRVMHECNLWLRPQFPELMYDAPRMVRLLKVLDSRLELAKGTRNAGDSSDVAIVVEQWIKEVRDTFALPENIPVYELAADMHTRINPIEEAEAMVGKHRVMVLRQTEKGD
jgi:hypothetical protein